MPDRTGTSRHRHVIERRIRQAGLPLFENLDSFNFLSNHCPLAALRCDLFSFDLAILDYLMPGLNGRELLLRMRALDVRLPIVLLTGFVDAVSHQDRVPFSRCIDKGMRIRHLLEVIEALLDPDDASDCGG